MGIEGIDELKPDPKEADDLAADGDKVVEGLEPTEEDDQIHETI